MSPPNVIYRRCPIKDEVLLERLGMAKHLSEKYVEEIKNEKLQTGIWDTHIHKVPSSLKQSEDAEKTRRDYGRTETELYPLARKLVGRLRKVILGNLPEDHPALKSELAAYLKGSVNHPADQLDVLWKSTQTMKKEAPLGSDLQGQPIDNILGRIRAYSSDRHDELKKNEKERANSYRFIVNSAWGDLKQLVYWAKSYFESGDARIAEFEALTRVR